MGENNLEDKISKKTASMGADTVGGSTASSVSSDTGSNSTNLGVKKNTNRGLLAIIVGIIVVVIVGVCVALVVVLNNNGGQSDDGNSEQTDVSDEQAFDAMMEQINNLKKEQIDAAKAEADATSDTSKKADAFSKRINNMIHDEEADVVGALMVAGEEYFDNQNNPAGTLAMYTAVDYDMLTSEPYVFLYYDKIMKLAEEVGDNEVKAEWQSRYDEAKANFDEYNAAFGEEDDTEE